MISIKFSKTKVCVGWYSFLAVIVFKPVVMWALVMGTGSFKRQNPDGDAGAAMATSACTSKKDTSPSKPPR